ncbi:MAG TPA: hypothetical protein VGN57_21220 [Pirellulaceae bacterium]|jgi:hypothetical protein|nr:hypothetical protein [Pirellulaceae bacterium]
MNDDEDRTNLERLIASARPAGPSQDLDARVRAALSAKTLPQPMRRLERPDRRLWFAVAASALVAASVGFLGGRLTAAVGGRGVAQNDSPPATAAPSTASERREQPEPGAHNLAPPSVTTVPLNDERLATLFLRPRSREGMLGSGPVRVEISQLP